MENRSSIINAVKRHVNKVNKITKTKLNKETKAKLMQRVNRSICVFESLSFISLPSFGNPLEIDYFHSPNDFKLIFSVLYQHRSSCRYAVTPSTVVELITELRLVVC